MHVPIQSNDCSVVQRNVVIYLARCNIRAKHKRTANTPELSNQLLWHVGLILSRGLEYIFHHVDYVNMVVREKDLVNGILHVSATNLSVHGK